MSVYFNKKDELKEKAVSHYKMMEASMGEEIAKCVKNTRVYGGDGIAVTSTAKKETDDVVAFDKYDMQMNVVVDNLDTVRSMLAHRDGKTAVLNFASYKNAGGKFMEGSSAQEECLCHVMVVYDEYIIPFHGIMTKAYAEMLAKLFLNTDGSMKRWQVCNIKKKLHKKTYSIQ